jgi:hypothetical protein
MSKTISPGVSSLALVLLAMALLASCGADKEEAGVVARVNSRPIYLKQLEAKYDLSHLGWVSGAMPSLGKVKQEYRKLLSELIAQELVFQVLEEKGIPVLNDELDRAEAEVRTDYPKGVFEQVLVEEYIDLGNWRQQLRAHLAYEKLLTKLLLPNVGLDPKDVERYYREHEEKFVIPPRVSLLFVAGANKEAVKAAAEACRREKNHQAVAEGNPGVAIQEIKSKVERLPQKWAEAIKDAAPGDATPPQPGQGGYEALVLLERLPMKKLDPGQAYPLVEKILAEQKLQSAFLEWLKNEVKDADIYVSKLLLAEEPAGAVGSTVEEPAAAKPKGVGKDSLTAPVKPLGP